MVGGHTDVRNTEKLLLVPHTEVAEVRCESNEDELNRNTVVVAIYDGVVGVNVRLPAASLKIDAQSVRRDVAEDFGFRKITSDKHGQQKSEGKVDRTESSSGNLTLFGVGCFYRCFTRCLRQVKDLIQIVVEVRLVVLLCGRNLTNTNRRGSGG